MTHSNGSNNNGFDGNDGNPPQILLPYQEWIETAYRQVMISAVQYISINGLPNNHSFYITFETTYPGVDIPDRLKAQYPNEITIVLQHQFWDLIVDEKTKIISVGLSFGGIPSTLVIPFGSITNFADPEAKLSLGFRPLPAPVSIVTEAPPHKNDPILQSHTSETKEDSQVVSLDAFRKK
ncbi:SspB family protein [Commensalibacter oyaizuii]|uniref:ClpXP protease specificity-enhancing factor SspB n=1 Tax=Commensalibacter oyaizuii TaxID=3043873 RepID=A0ABT6Q3Y3_9PROT|nr:ClpXP protease specificity-enhancing factor SspB [Commensalibacter sp. TBRC 16381]MDI2091828.1 ClpXP protease specificity-enhancing factor SspB [Commensalibacter sp. TBRC 16381]